MDAARGYLYTLAAQPSAVIFLHNSRPTNLLILTSPGAKNHRPQLPPPAILSSIPRTRQQPLLHPPDTHSPPPPTRLHPLHPDGATPPCHWRA